MPIMMIPDAVDKHVGTIDVDLAINDKTLLENGCSEGTWNDRSGIPGVFATRFLPACTGIAKEPIIRSWLGRS